MRVEPFEIGDYVHVFNRGNRKMNITRSEKDCWRFMQALRFFNDSHSSVNVLRLLKSNFNNQADSVFELGWPLNWPQKDPLVKILCYCLVPNHFHLLLKEIREKAISKFVQKVGGGYTKYFNIKHQEVGRLFQSSYKAKLIDSERYLEYLSVYIQVINIMQLSPGGIEAAEKNIDKSMKFVEEYQFSSYRDFVGLRESLIIDKDTLGETFIKPKDYKEFVFSVLSDKLSVLKSDFNSLEM